MNLQVIWGFYQYSFVTKLNILETVFSFHKLCISITILLFNSYYLPVPNQFSNGNSKCPSFLWERTIKDGIELKISRTWLINRIRYLNSWPWIFNQISSKAVNIKKEAYPLTTFPHKRNPTNNKLSYARAKNTVQVHFKNGCHL